MDEVRILGVFHHQVAGHGTLLHLEGGMIAKPLIPREYWLYLWLQEHFPALRRFTASCHGYVSLDVAALPSDFGDGFPAPLRTDALAWGPPISEHALPGHFLVLSDLTSGYARPNVCDVKLGVRQHGISCRAEKAEIQRQKCRSTTSASLALRLCGSKRWSAAAGRYEARSKHLGRALPDAPALAAALRAFAPSRATRAVWVRELREMRALPLERVVLYSASLLLIEEGDEGDGKTEPIARLVDFAHSYDAETVEAARETGETDLEDGVREGLDNLIRFLEDEDDMIDEEKTEGKT